MRQGIRPPNDKKPYAPPRLVLYGTIEKLTGMQGFRVSEAEEKTGFGNEERPFAS